jgi:hypothetical protein
MTVICTREARQGKMGGSHEALAMHDEGAKLDAFELKHGVDLQKARWMEGGASGSAAHLERLNEAQR